LDHNHHRLSTPVTSKNPTALRSADSCEISRRPYKHALELDGSGVLVRSLRVEFLRIVNQPCSSGVEEGKGEGESKRRDNPARMLSI
jgi:hypothetical protein